jgi:hypothetical protein
MIDFDEISKFQPDSELRTHLDTLFASLRDTELIEIAHEVARRCQERTQHPAIISTGLYALRVERERRTEARVKRKVTPDPLTIFDILGMDGDASQGDAGSPPP